MVWPARQGRRIKSARDVRRVLRANERRGERKVAAMRRVRWRGRGVRSSRQVYSEERKVAEREGARVMRETAVVARKLTVKQRLMAMAAAKVAMGIGRGVVMVEGLSSGAAGMWQVGVSSGGVVGLRRDRSSREW